MGICCNSDTNSTKRNQRLNSFTIDKSNLTKFKQKYYTEVDGTSTAAASSSKQNYKPEVYTLNNFGVQVKTKQKISQPLKFLFHIYDIKCRMLTENTLYILDIVFDGREFPLSFGNGNNPSFVFNESFGKEISFEKMATSFLEVNLYTHKDSLYNLHTKGEILADSQIYSCFKINLLTIALGPKKHDLELIDPVRKKVNVGRINYFISCYHIGDMHLRINKFKINLNNLKFNEIALNLKFENKNLKRVKESQYTDNFTGIPNNKENTMTYEYPSDKKDLYLGEGISEDSSYISEENQNENNNKNGELKINTDINVDNKKTFNITEKTQKIINFNNIINNKISDKLFFHGKLSMYELYNSQFSLNIFSVRLLNNLIEIEKNEDVKAYPLDKKDSRSDRLIKKEFFMKKLDLPNVAKNNLIKQRLSKKSKINLNLINSYELIGSSSLNFQIIFHELEEKLSKISYRLFQSMSNKKNGLIKTLSGSKIMKFGIEQDLTNKVQSNKNLCNIKDNEIRCGTQHLTINLFETGEMRFNEEIYCEGESIGSIEITLEIENLPLIRQIKFGVMTETGFEINSIFLYDNLNISNDLPEPILDLIRLKEKFEKEMDFSVLKQIKLCLEKTVVDNSLYYGYPNSHDLYQGQDVLIDLGLGLFDLLDKVNFESFHLIFELLKLIVKRGEFDLGTLSSRWFKPKNIIKKKQSTYYLKEKKEEPAFSINYDDVAYEFSDNYLVEKHLIEKYLNFHGQLLNYCLNDLSEGKNINNSKRDFTFFYLSCAFVQIPPFRNSFIEIINNSINLKDEKYLKFASHNYLNFSKEDNLNMKPNNNFMMWDSFFYISLDTSINFYMNEINNNNNDNKKSNFNGLENIKAIKDKLSNINNITEIKEEKEKNYYEFYQQNWYIRLSKRDFIFYDLINALFSYMNEVKNKLYMKSEDTNGFFYPFQSENIRNILGINHLINAICYDLLTKDAKNYPKQIKEIILQFYTDIYTINNFMTIMLSTTNVYDTLSIFNLLDILDYLFNKELDYTDYHRDYIKDNLDYNLIKKSFFIIIKSDNSLAIAKFIWFYYKNISLLGHNHSNEIITSLLTNYFYILFFHWSFQVREIFYFFIIFILGYKIKKQIRKQKDKNDGGTETITITHNQIKANITKKISFNIFADINENNINNKISNTREYFYVEDYLIEDMIVVTKLQKIIENEKFDLTYMDNIQFQDKDILIKMPQEPHGNVIECIKQYNNVFTKFNIWKKNIEENKITEDQIEYPRMEISIMKDDTIQYEY